MNMILHELRAHRKSILIWSVSIILFVYIGMMKYAGLSSVGDDAMKMFESLPGFIKTILGLAAFDISSIKGFYGLFFLYFLIMASIHAIMLGSLMLLKEERDKTADFLLSKPISRKKIITSKIIASLCIIIVFNVVTLVSSILVVGFYNTGASINKEIIFLMIAMFLYQLFFLSIGFLLSSIVKKAKTATSISMAIILGTYIISVLIDLNKDLSFLEILTPFKYFKAQNIMAGSIINSRYAILICLVIIFSIIGSYLRYEKKDIHV